MLKIYYQEWFPFEQIANLLDINGQYGIYGREFGYAVQNDDTTLKFTRNYTYRDVNGWKRSVWDLVPDRIEVGSIHDLSLSTSITSNNERSREFRFDIDLDAYDDLRLCGCKQAGACSDCWEFAAVAAKVLDASAKQDLGADTLLWVFSGRRGIHGWLYNNKQKQQRADLSISVSDTDKRQVLLNRVNLLHTIIQKHTISQYNLAIQIPWVSDAVRGILVPAFRDKLNKKHKLMTRHGKKWLDNMPESIVSGTGMSRKRIDKLVFSNPLYKDNDEKMWARLEKIKTINKTGFSPAEWIAMVSLAPRLDEPVSLGKRHMMKLPFCVHPSTNAICIPLCLENLSDFNPRTAPTLESLFSSDDLTTQHRFLESIRILEKIVS